MNHFHSALGFFGCVRHQRGSWSERSAAPARL